MSIATLDERLCEVEAILRDHKGGEAHATALQQLLTRLASLEGALREQRLAFSSLTTAQAIQRDTTLPLRSAAHDIATERIAAPQQTHALEVAASSSAVAAVGEPRAGTTIKTPPARAPLEPLPRPPPVRTSFPKPPRPPSPLQRTISASTPSQSPGRSEFTQAVSSSPGLARAPLSPQPSAAIQQPSQQKQEDVPTVDVTTPLGFSPGRQNTIEGSTLRERRAAFAALQQPAVANQRTKARSRASLAIEAARREVERAARRSAREATIDREGESGVLSWLAFILLILLGFGALFAGVMMMVARESWERASSSLGPIYRVA